MRRLFGRLLLCQLLVLVSFQLKAQESGNGEPVSDVRVLIDVSGSMKQNDPKNLRVPALKMLVNLLPPGSRAGVWIFSENNQQLAPLGSVDEDWKSAALSAAGKIHSRGMFTDIEMAITGSTTDWKANDENSRRSLILLTDGVVDVSKEAAKSEASKQRIIAELLPNIQQLGVQLHTVALSDNADQELLKKLAFETGGWNESAQSAEQLHRVFLKMFKKAVPRDSVPLKENRFTIDGSISEFSILVFRKEGASPTKLIDPEEQVIEQSGNVGSVKWLHEKGFDLITVSAPVPGEWQLVAESDPDNQVMIVTDLKLMVSELPNHMSEGELFEFEAYLTEKGNLIDRKDFLDLVTVELKQTDDLERSRSWDISVDEGERGYYRESLGKTISAGEQTFALRVDGKTFQREWSQTVNVVENPVMVEVTGDSNGAQKNIVITLVPDEDLIDFTTMAVEGLLLNSDGDNKPVEMSQLDDKWEMRLLPPLFGGRLVVNFNVTAKTLRGHEITPKVRPVVIDRNRLEKLFPPEAEEVSEDVAEDAGDEAPEPEEEAVEEDSEELTEEVSEKSDSEEGGWMVTTAIIVGVNLLLGGAGFFGYRWYRKMAAEADSKLIDKLSS